ncbi:anaerobic sulfatase-maturating enzyme [Lachnospiraceae bacterium]|nr:anaerobic sulfatase-maturating enzyme [Lachnospiraceae bacterium]
MNSLLNNRKGFYPHYIKELDNEIYLYNIITNGIFLLNQQEYKALVGNIDINNEQNKEIKNFFEENFIIITDKNKKILDKLYQKTISSKKGLNATSLTLMVSQACNLRCKYCYGDGGEYSHKGFMSYEIAKRAVEFFVDQTQEKKLNICFFGGEPLLNYDLVKRIVDYTKDIAIIKEKEFTYSMTTNATLITPEIEQFIQKNKISITVSMDGTKETNDINRYYANKKGAYDDINAKTVNLKNFITIRATIAPPNLNIEENLVHIIEELQYKRTAWAEADNLLSESDYEVLFEHTMKLYDRFEQMLKEGKITEVKKYYSFVNVLRKFYHDGIRSKGCGSGTNMMAVDIDGKIYPCHRFVGVEASILGDVCAKEMNDTKFYLQAELANFEKCKYCLARSICGGGCVNENFFANNFINEPSKKHCDYRINIVDRLLEIFIHMSDKEKQLLLD